MEKLNIKNREEDIYRLEINDNGDYIEFDLLDIGLPAKVIKSAENIERLEKEYSKRILEAEEKHKDDETELLKNIILIEAEKHQEERKYFDMFLGEGTCNKIFGDKNYEGMFNDLMEGLNPHFDKMKIDMERIKENLKEKYKLKDNDVM